MDTVFTIPAGTYFIAYPGSVATGEVLLIPKWHRREGDQENNEQVRVIVQNDVVDFTQLPYAHEPVLILDGANTRCASIYVPNAWQIDTNEQLKIARGINPYATVATTDFNCIVFYKKP